MEDILPIGPEEWVQVFYVTMCATHIVRQYQFDKKYNNLHRIKVPTGDPNCPNEVKQAKWVNYSIGNRVYLGSGEEDFELETRTFTGTDVLGPESVELNVIARNSVWPPETPEAEVTAGGVAIISAASSVSRISGQ